MTTAAVAAIPEIPKRAGVDQEWNMDLDALDLHIPQPAINVRTVVCVAWHGRNE